MTYHSIHKLYIFQLFSENLLFGYDNGHRDPQPAKVQKIETTILYKSAPQETSVLTTPPMKS